MSDVPGDTRPLGLSPSDMSLHGYALGPTGVGKTHLLQLIAEAAMHAGQPLLVLDPKAQMHEHLLERVPKDRYKDVVLIDGTEEHPMGFNPLDASGRDPDVVADSVLAVFARVFADGWGPRTADIFSASLRTLTRTGSVTSPNTLVDLPRLWTDTAFRRRLVAQVHDDVALAGFWSWYESLRPAAQAAVIASPMNKLRQVLLRPTAVKIVGQRRPGFRLRDVFRDRAIVLLPLNEGLLGPLTTELIGSLAIAEAWQAVQERATEKRHAKHPGLVIVDEADRFMHLPVSLVDALARSRSLSVSWWLATQYWDQLPKEMKSAVKTNARSKVIFRLESDDDARTIARMAPELSEQDFMALGKYQVYLRLVAQGVTTSWALARTLPATEPSSDPSEVRRVSHDHHRGAGEDDEASVAPVPEALVPPAQPARLPGPVGRRKRST
ncbi:type IV secretory system conjugative DNA transfer family protein [Leifsonia sp. RAF41]|uniref:type IV secretory system conjugative DNA transfer family protein n=1 Tax=Leifsonia sp. RAF41 TaxID=3233056 RepID=UPI003F989D91